MAVVTESVSPNGDTDSFLVIGPQEMPSAEAGSAAEGVSLLLDATAGSSDSCSRACATSRPTSE
jgi:hypothetical protein